MKTTEILRITTTHGTSGLCRACSAVLLMEGEVAGDPRDETWKLREMKALTPAPAGSSCDACAARREGKAWRETVLTAPPMRLVRRSNEEDTAIALAMFDEFGAASY